MTPSVVVLTNALIVDGTGSAAFLGEVWVSGGFISRITMERETHPPQAVVLDMGGRVVAPGFIDVHSHADNAAFLDQFDTSKILQGVTTEVTGNCGMTLAPRSNAYRDELTAYAGRLFPDTVWDGETFHDFWQSAETKGLVTHVAPLVGQGTLRILAMGLENRQPTARERQDMHQALRGAMDAGAFGLSTGLIYPPGSFTPTEEIIDLCRQLEHGLYASHLRGESLLLEESVAEAIEIGREAGVAVQLSHHKAAGPENWGKTVKTLATVDHARATGQEVRLDVYPYTASSTMLTACLPTWAEVGGHHATMQRLIDPAMQRQIRRDIEGGLPGWENHLESAGVEGILICTTADHAYEGQTLAEAAKGLSLEPIAALFHILVQEELRASMIVFSMADADLERVLLYPWTMIGSDGLPPGSGGRPHPRLFGTFPRVLGRYVRDIPILGLEQAVYKMTGLPADTFGIAKRGLIREGYRADLVVFSADTIADTGSYGGLPSAPSGIFQVYQDGQLVVDDGRYLGIPRGHWLKHGVDS